MGAVTGQEIRLEAIKAAAKVAAKNEGIGNLLVHADWISDFILDGKQTLIEAEGPNRCKANDSHREDRTP